MRNRQTLFTLTIWILLFTVLLGACKRASSTATQTLSISPSPLPSQEATASATATASFTPQTYPQPTIPIIASQTGIPYPQPPGQTGSPTAGVISPTPYQPAMPSSTLIPTDTPVASETQTLEPPTPTETNTVIPQYPGPGGNPTITPPYPGPIITNTMAPYPGPATSTPRPTLTPSRSITPTATRSGTTSPFPTPTTGSGTPVSTPTELPPRHPLSPAPPGSSVTIWHSWSGAETETLQSIIQSFQRIYPNVTFSLLYVPLDDLFSTYQEAAYLGQGPSLLLGPAEWGPQLFEEELITDLNLYVPTDYLSSINSAALASGEYHLSLISLPLSQHGMVMFRNTSIINTAPITFDKLNSLSQQVTHGGIVGSYLERGSFFSAGNIIGLGGRLMDEEGYPTFNDQFGLEWFDLLADYDVAGAVTFNTNRDLDMFKRGRVGIVIDGTWNISLLTQAIGKENLAIDPWPSYGTGYMSGWVESDSVFLNANTTSDNRFAALSFIGYLLDPNVQMHLAEVGHIPSVSAALPRDILMQQAMAAFSYGVPYPITVDESILKLYWYELDMAIQNVFVRGVSPASALKTASDNLVIQIRNIQTSP